MEKDLIKAIDFWKKSLRSDIYGRSILEKMNFSTKEVIDLVGIRRCGKSSILNLIVNRLKLKDDFLYINFEDPFFIEHNNPQIFEKLIAVYKEYFNENLKYLFFDEVQNISWWEKAVRKLRDEGRYKIFITGSSSKLLSREISTLLTGRHISYQVHPLSFSEFLSFKNIAPADRKDLVLKESRLKKEFVHFLQIGGFPEAVIKNDAQILKNYFYDVLYKDIVVRHNIRESDVLEKIAIFLFSNSAKVHSTESIRKAYKISFESAANYLSFLKEAFLVFELASYAHSLKKQSNLPRKIYSADTGIANAVSFKFSKDEGRILENAAFLELLKRGLNLFYYRGKNECDFVVKEKEKITQVIQTAQELNQDNIDRELAGLIEAAKFFNLKKGLILTESAEDSITKNGIKIAIKPLWKWALEN